MTSVKQFIKERCYDFGTLYSLDSDLNNIGLTIRQTHAGDMILCRLMDGEPVAESLGIDHLYIGVQSKPRTPIPNQLIRCILEFIDVASGEPSKPEQAESSAHIGHMKLYGNFVGPIVQDMALNDADGDLLEAIREWCDAKI